jgi:hypothetical protein
MQAVECGNRKLPQTPITFASRSWHDEDDSEDRVHEHHSGHGSWQIQVGRVMSRNYPENCPDLVEAVLRAMGPPPPPIAWLSLKLLALTVTVQDCV